MYSMLPFKFSNAKLKTLLLFFFVPTIVFNVQSQTTISTNHAPPTNLYAGSSGAIIQSNGYTISMSSHSSYQTIDGMQVIRTATSSTTFTITKDDGGTFRLIGLNTGVSIVGGQSHSATITYTSYNSSGNQIAQVTHTATSPLGPATVSESNLGAVGSTLASSIVLSSSSLFFIGHPIVQTTPVGPVATAPTVSTSSPATAITATTATLAGNVTDDGGDAITARGVVYGTSVNPTVGGAGVTNLTSSGTTGSFTVNATGLTGSTTYNYRAYATNGQGTSYGANQTFTTAAACALSASITSHSDLNCNGDNSGSATVTASNGTANYDYVWSNTASTSGSSSTTNTISGLAATTYTVTVTDGNGCTAIASETLTEPTVLNGGSISGN